MAEIDISPGHGCVARYPTIDTLSGRGDPGMFGRMFPQLDKFRPDDAKLDALAEAMQDVAAPPTSVDPATGALNIDRGDNPNVPAGFTYLGQFIDHDITLDLTSLSKNRENPAATKNFRTPRLDLDAVYGLGTDGSPYLYARTPPQPNTPPGPKLLLGKNRDMDVPPGVFRNDLPRNSEGCALLGDHRNDENLLVAQTHLAFLKFHNKVVDTLAGSSASTIFAQARRIVTWHYQWMVLYDFLERLTTRGIVATILESTNRIYQYDTTPYMPVEFSAAAFRFGHSMVREVYSLNRIFDNIRLKHLLQMTGLRGNVIGEAGGGLGEQFQAVPSSWIIDWRRWYDFNTPPSGFLPPTEPGGPKFNFSRRIDPFIAPALQNLPGDVPSLAARNLRRGAQLGLPCGQDVATAIRVQNALTPDEIATGPDGLVAKQQGLHEKTPLWYTFSRKRRSATTGSGSDRWARPS
jgi:Animal haem peroxidase